jgi:hypothetical protein
MKRNKSQREVELEKIDCPEKIIEARKQLYKRILNDDYKSSPELSLNYTTLEELKIVLKKTETIPSEEMDYITAKLSSDESQEMRQNAVIILQIITEMGHVLPSHAKHALVMLLNRERTTSFGAAKTLSYIDLKDDLPKLNFKDIKSKHLIDTLRMTSFALSNTSLHCIAEASNSLNIDQLIWIIVERSISLNAALYLKNNQLGFWENNTFHEIPIDPSQINQIEALIAQYIGNEPLSMATEGNCTII